MYIVRFVRRFRRQSEAAEGDEEEKFVYDTEKADSSGPWGPWLKPPSGPSSTCSRTCGGGVQVEMRRCEDAASEGACQGPSQRYSSCNVGPCPRGSRDYREEQCAAFNDKAFEGKLHDWIPYLKAPRKCELNCMPRGERYYYRYIPCIH